MDAGVWYKALIKEMSSMFSLFLVRFAAFDKLDKLETAY